MIKLCPCDIQQWAQPPGHRTVPFPVCHLVTGCTEILILKYFIDYQSLKEFCLEKSLASVTGWQMRLQYEVFKTTELATQ